MAIEILHITRDFEKIKLQNEIACLIFIHNIYLTIFIREAEQTNYKSIIKNAFKTFISFVNYA